MEPEARRRRGALRGAVRWLQHYDLDGFPAGEHAGLPSTTVTLVVPVGQELDLGMNGGRARFATCLAGLYDGPATIHHDGTQRGIQLALDPLQVRRLLGVPAQELSGRAVELGDVVGHRVAATLSDRLAAEPGWPGRLRLVEDMLLDQLARHERVRAVRPEVAHAWALLSGSGGAARVRDVAARVGWSPRHLAQELTATVGLAPKTVARIMRFERSAALVKAGHRAGMVAVACGYADQAHMTREWRTLAGTTPGRWLRDDVLANVQDNREPRQQDRRHEH